MVLTRPFMRVGNRVVDSPPVKLGDNILTATAASVSFVVPTGYDELILFWHDVYGNGGADQAITMTFNSDTAGNYDTSRQAFGAASSTTNAASGIILDYCGDTDDDQMYANGFITIFNRLAQEKVCIGTANWYDKADVQINDVNGRHIEAKWRNTTAAIFSITRTPSSGSLVVNSRFTLLGIATKDGR